jgi:uncharacterized protein YwgA
MKGLFVFVQETPRGWLPGTFGYVFEPYYWGPFSKVVYDDIDYLVEIGLLEKHKEPGRSWNTYSITPRGEIAVNSFSENIDSRALTYLRQIKEAVTELSFSSLLKKVYSKYPRYAAKSVFRP